MERPKALVAASDPRSTELISIALEGAGFSLAVFATWPEVEAVLLRLAAVLVVVDAGEAAADDLEERIRRLTRIRPGAVVVVAGRPAHGATAENLMRAGALEVVAATDDPDPLRAAALRARRELRLLEELYRLRTGRGARVEEPALVGTSPAIVRLRDELARMAGHDKPGWLVGPPGSGRVHAGRWIHRHSSRAEGPLMVVSAKGSAAGDVLLGAGDRPGALDGALLGSLVVEEIDVLAEPVQRELARRMAQAGAARVLVTSSREPARCAEAGALVPELAGALGDRAARVPALGERPEDVAPLARHFLRSICEVNDLPPLSIADGVLTALEGYDWPGNVSELRNAVEHAALVASSGEIRFEDLPRSIREVLGRQGRRPAAQRRSFRDAKNDVVREFERRYLEELLECNAGNVTAASNDAGMLRSALQRLLRKHALRSSAFRRRHLPR